MSEGIDPATDRELRHMAVERLLVSVIAMISGMVPEGPEFVLRHVRLEEQRFRLTGDGKIDAYMSRVFEVQRELLEMAIRAPDEPEH